VNNNGQDKKKKRIWTGLFVLCNIAVIAATALNEFAGKEAGIVRLVFSRRAVFYLGCTALCLAALLLAESLKYYLMMRSVGEKRSFRVAFETAALGKYYDCITPSGAGGQPFQISWLRKHGYSAGGASAMTVTGFITMQAGFIVLAVAVFIVWRSVELEAIRYLAYFGLLLFALIPCLLALFSFMPGTVKKMIASVIRLGARLKLVRNPEETTEKVCGMLDSYHESISVIAKDRFALLGLFGLSLVYRVALCSMPYFVLRMFGTTVEYLPIFVSTIYIYASIALAPTPGNAGAAEGAFYLVFSAMGPDGVFWAMLVWRLFCYYSFILIGALIYGVNALQKRRRRGGTADE
jgi:conserved hypothetical protein